MEAAAGRIFPLHVFLKVHSYTIAQSFRVKVGDGFWGCFILEKETQEVEKGFCQLSRTLAPAMAGQGYGENKSNTLSKLGTLPVREGVLFTINDGKPEVLLRDGGR